MNKNDDYFAVSLVNNCIKVVSSLTNSVVTVMDGMKKPLQNTCSSRKNELIEGCVVEPKNGFVVLSSGPGTLQVHDVKTDTHIKDIAVSKYNVISRTENTQMKYPQVEHCCFSSDGAHMATIERRDDANVSEVIKLKFWHFDADIQEYVNNTIIDAPHKTKVMDLKFSPKSLMLVTCGMDKKFRVWKASKSKDDSGYSWYNHCVGFYKDYFCKSVDFSEDGTLLAVSYGQTVTLWDPESNVLKKTLSHPPPFSSLKYVRFVHGTPFLIAVSEDYLHVWNLISCSVWWSHKLRISFVALSKVTNTFVAFVENCKGKKRSVEVAYKFSVSSPLPVACFSFGKRMGDISFACFVNARSLGKDNEELVVFNSDRSFFFVSEDGKLPVEVVLCLFRMMLKVTRKTIMEIYSELITLLKE